MDIINFFKSLFIDPQLQLFWYFLLAYIGLYLFILIITHVVVRFRRAGGMRSRLVVRRVAILGLILHATFPAYWLVTTLMSIGTAGGWYYLPYGAVLAIDIIFILAAWSFFAKSRRD